MSDESKPQRKPTGPAGALAAIVVIVGLAAAAGLGLGVALAIVRALWRLAGAV